MKPFLPRRKTACRASRSAASTSRAIPCSRPRRCKPCWRPLRAAQRDFSDIARAVEALEAAYHERGYSAVQVQLPEQELERGVVRLSVLQTPLGKVAISGNTYVDEANVRRALPALREGETPNLTGPVAKPEAGQ